jgi:hypothetical protein
MKPDRRQVLFWEIGGVLFIIGFGLVLRFIYGWSNYNPVIGFFGAVNESVWERLKLGFWPLVLFAIIEYPANRKKTGNFFFAKLLGLIALEAIVLIAYYAYTSYQHRPMLLVDLSAFALGVIVCQSICLRMFGMKKHHGVANAFSLFGLILIAATFMLFTYIPPKAEIFRDRISGKYGTEWNMRK